MHTCAHPNCFCLRPTHCSWDKCESRVRQEKPKADVQAQLDRLTKMMGGSMAPDLKKWVAQRVNILKQIAA